MAFLADELIKHVNFVSDGRTDGRTDIIRKVDQVVSEKKAFFWFLVSMWHFKSELSSKHLAV